MERDAGSLTSNFLIILASLTGSRQVELEPWLGSWSELPIEVVVCSSSFFAGIVGLWSALCLPRTQREEVIHRKREQRAKKRFKCSGIPGNERWRRQILTLIGRMRVVKERA